MEQSKHQGKDEPAVGLLRLSGHGLRGVAEPFAWLDALFVDPPRLTLRVLHADEMEATLDEELVEDDADEFDADQKTVAAVNVKALVRKPTARACALLILCFSKLRNVG